MAKTVTSATSDECSSRRMTPKLVRAVAAPGTIVSIPGRKESSTRRIVAPIMTHTGESNNWDKYCLFLQRQRRIITIWQSDRSKVVGHSYVLVIARVTIPYWQTHWPNCVSWSVWPSLHLLGTFLSHCLLPLKVSRFRGRRGAIFFSSQLVSANEHTISSTIVANYLLIYKVCLDIWKLFFFQRCTFNSIN